MIDPTEAVSPLLDQIEEALRLKLSYLALMGALAVPDIMAGLAAEGGRTSAAKYRAWVDEFVGNIEGERLYTFRCSMLHQGSAVAQDNSTRTIFVEPNDERIQIHNGDDWMSIPVVVHQILGAARAWLDEFGATNRVQRNLQRYARRWPDGIAELGVDIPVIG